MLFRSDHDPSSRAGFMNLLPTALVFLGVSLGLGLSATGASAVPGGIVARAYGAWVNIPSAGILNRTICDSGWLPPTGGILDNVEFYEQIPGVLQFLYMSASSHDDDCGGAADFSTADLDDVVILAGRPEEISFASVTQSDDDECCNPDDIDFHAASIVGLVAGGSPITVTGLPNQSVVIPGGTLVINEMILQHHEGACDDDDITLNALHLYLQDGGEVILGSAHHDDDDDCCASKTGHSTWGKVKSLYR